jgi:hypothetical protein
MNRELGVLALVSMLSGCFVPHQRTTFESLTPLSATYCATTESVPDPDKLAADHCAEQGLIAKRVTDNARCKLTVLELGRHYSYECVKKP